jgi:broad specificity phosphatase PhoE
MKLILVRHGHTAQNDKGLYNGHNHSSLTIKGLNQARRLALRLRNEAIDAIYSSDLPRAKQTAKKIAKHHPLRIRLLKDYREMNFGKYEGLPRHLYPLKKKGIDIRAKGLETEASVARRAKKVLNYLVKKHKHGTVVLVGHGHINWIMHHLIHKKSTKGKTFKSMRQTAVSIYKIIKGKSRTLLLNCTKHLESSKTKAKRNKLKKRKK